MTAQAAPRFVPAGERGFYIYFESRIEPAVNRRVQAVANGLQQNPLPGLIDLIPTYSAIFVQFDPLQATFGDWVAHCTAHVEGWQQVERREARVYLLPVCYGGEYGPDLREVAAYHGLSPRRVVEMHAEPVYYIYFLGFTPGFPFLGGLPQALATPRLERPRLRVPAGSVGIAGAQTGVYPVDSSGGWRLIGRTPLPLYRPDPGDPTSVLLQPGHYLKFIPISASGFEKIAAAVAAGRWRIAWEPYDG